MTFELILLGLFVGAITGVTGASGVLMLVPILTTFFDMPLHIILGTSLMVDVIASIAVSIAYFKNKNLNIKGSLWLIIGALIGAQIGSLYVIGVSKIFIIVILALCMVFFGVEMWLSGSTKKQHKQLILPDHVSESLKTPAGMIISGLVIGFLTGLFGAGGGLSVFIILYSFLRFPIKKAIGTSSFVMLLTAMSGVIGYAHHGNLDVTLGLTLGVSAAVGGAISSVLANRINEKLLARLIGAFFVFMAVVMIILKVLAPYI